MPNISAMAVFTQSSRLPLSAGSMNDLEQASRGHAATDASGPSIFDGVSPFFAERANFLFEDPGAARLAVKLPVGLGDGGRRHQPIRIEIL